MDTLSRKHRLRQHHQEQKRSQLQQQQQVLYGSKENHRVGIQFGQNYELDCDSAAHNNNNNNNNQYKITNNRQEEDEEEEEFKVFKVLEINRKSLNDQHQYKLMDQPQTASATNGNSNNKKLNQSRRRRLKTSEEEEDDDVIGQAGDEEEENDFSIVCMESVEREQIQRVHKQQAAGNHLIFGREQPPVYATTTTATDHRSSTDTARSTGDSSGFLSEGSGHGTNQSSRSRSSYATSGLNNHHQMAKAQKHHQLYVCPNQGNLHHIKRPSGGRLSSGGRSRVIEDLDQLMADVLSRSSSSPTESYLSCADSTLPIGDSTLTRGRELDYSTLCRDEFSSFIAVESKLNGHAATQNMPPTTTHTDNANGRPEPRMRRQSIVSGVGQPPQAGPMLVGVHDNDHQQLNLVGPFEKPRPARVADHGQYLYQNQYHHHLHQALGTSTSCGSSDTDPLEASTQDEIRSSSSCLSTTTTSRSSGSHCEQSLDHTANDYDVDSPPVMTTKELQHDDDVINTHELLDAYVNRVDSIRRLAEGDKSVTMDDLFGSSGGREILVSQEYRTAIEFTPLIGNTEFGIIQEIEMLEMPIDCGGNELEEENYHQKHLVSRNVINANFRSILSASATVWPHMSWPPPPAGKSLHDDDVLVYGRLKNSSKCDDELSLIKLEESLLSRLLVADNKVVERHHPSNKNSNLVKIVRRHLIEFIDHYVDFHNGLSSPEVASYANDWHQNWLFAYKRRPSYDDDDIYDNDGARLSRAFEDGHRVSPKRARMSLVDDEDEDQAVQFIIEQDDDVNDDNEDYQQERLAKDQDNNNNYHSSALQPPVDLIRYSTLLMSKCNSTIRLNYHIRTQPQPDDNDDKRPSFEIDKFYEAQEDRLSELLTSSRDSSGQIDVCRLLLMDSSDDDHDDADSGKDQQGSKSNSGMKASKQLAGAAKLVINYYSSSSLVPNWCANQLYRFHAFGYLFQLPIMSVLFDGIRAERLALIRRRILAKMADLFESSASCSAADGGSQIKCGPEKQVKFLVNLTNVELVNELPVIQFCAKVGGSLPIRVSWFRDGQEISSLFGERTRHGLRVRQSSSASQQQPNWPIEMHGNYDYEYQNDWGSWYRFRRCHGDLLFEIRDAKLDCDYGKAYRCVVQNHCSRKECSFALTRRRRRFDCGDSKAAACRNGDQLTQLATSTGQQPARLGKLSAIKRSGLSGETSRYGHALLRTWSQRTMPRPQPPVAGADEHQKRASGNDPNGQLQHHQTSYAMAMSRRSSACAPRDEDKFGQDFPYYPENLLKRLEENKFLVKCNPKLSMKQQRSLSMAKVSGNSPASLVDVCDGDGVAHILPSPQLQFTDSFELFTGDEIHHHKNRRTTIANDGPNDDELETRMGQQDDDRVWSTGEGQEIGLPLRLADATSADRLNNSANSIDDKITAPRPRQRLKQPTNKQVEENPSPLVNHYDVGNSIDRTQQVSTRFTERNQAKLSSGHGLSTQGPAPSKNRKLADQQQQQQVAETSSTLGVVGTTELPIEVPAAITSSGAVSQFRLADHHHQVTLAPTVMSGKRRPNEEVGRSGHLEQQQTMVATMEPERSPTTKLEECKPRTNVKSLISRFSLA